MGDIRDFGERLKKLAEAHNAQPLVDYGEELLNFAKSYDISNINNALKEFPGLVETLTRKE